MGNKNMRYIEAYDEMMQLSKSISLLNVEILNSSELSFR